MRCPFGARSQANPPGSLLRRVLCLRVHPSRPAAEEAGPAWLRHGPGSQAEVAGHDPRRGPRLHHLGSLPGQPATTGLQPLPADHARSPRSGPSLVTGLVYCGRCGQKMRVAYHAKGLPAYYVCTNRHQKPLDPACQCFSGKQVEALVIEEVCAIQPTPLELHERALADLKSPPPANRTALAKTAGTGPVPGRSSSPAVSRRRAGGPPGCAQLERRREEALREQAT